MEFTQEFIRLATSKGMTADQLWASMSIGKEVVVTDTKAVKSTKTAKLTKGQTVVSAVSTTPVVASPYSGMEPADFVRMFISKLRKSGTYEQTVKVKGPDGQYLKDTDGKFVRVKTGLVKPVSKGCHVIIDGLNDTIRENYKSHPVYGQMTPRQIIDDLAAKGLVVVKFASKGAMVYLPEDAPTSSYRNKSRLAELMAK